MLGYNDFTPFIEQLPPINSKFIIANDENINKPRDTVFRSASWKDGSKLIKLARDNGCIDYRYINNLYWKKIEFKGAA